VNKYDAIEMKTLFFVPVDLCCIICSSSQRASGHVKLPVSHCADVLNECGSEVGYWIRFEKSKTQHTRIVSITEGLLLKQVNTGA
jgi:hypothetical protein